MSELLAAIPHRAVNRIVEPFVTDTIDWLSVCLYWYNNHYNNDGAGETRERHKSLKTLKYWDQQKLPLLAMVVNPNPRLKTLKYWDQQKTHGFMSFIESQNLVSKLVCLNHGCLVPHGCLMSWCLLMYYHSWKRTILLLLIIKVIGSNVAGNPRRPHGWAICDWGCGRSFGLNYSISGILHKNCIIIRHFCINISLLYAELHLFVFAWVAASLSLVLHGVLHGSMRAVKGGT